MPKRGRRRKKNRTQGVDSSTDNPSGALSSSEETKVAKSLVIRRGKCESVVADLVQDVRHLMMPYTAANFHEAANDRKLTLNKYCQHVCLPMGITHILAFSQNEERLNLRVAKTPQGPTLTFRVHQFSLTKHIQKLQRRPVSITTLIEQPPIVVTNNFGDNTAEPQIKLMRITFQNMFPPINVANVKLKNVRRVVLFHLVDDDEEEEDNDDDNDNDNNDQNNKTKKQRVEVRHYAIKATPVGIDKKVRRLIQAKIPNLNKVNDISDYISGTAQSTNTVDNASDSEPEEGSNAVVELAQNYTRGNKKQSKSALKLVELGPRLSLELIKVEQGLSDGAVMYHAHVTKTLEEVQALQKKVEDRSNLKKQRREQQEANVERKRHAKESKREAKRLRKEQREKATLDDLRNKKDNNSDNDDDDDEQIGVLDDDDHSSVMDDDFDEDGEDDNNED